MLIYNTSTIVNWQIQNSFSLYQLIIHAEHDKTSEQKVRPRIQNEYNNINKLKFKHKIIIL